MDLEIAIPSEVNQRKTNIIYIHYILYYIYIYIRHIICLYVGSKKRIILMNLYTKQK